ncbi:MAG: squalene/phytoene synthase family protein, partial [Actinomycetes bacterium]
MTSAAATPSDLDAAYRECQRLARAHYENFPVASWLLPAAMRPHVAAVYAFARVADDVADEG